MTIEEKAAKYDEFVDICVSKVDKLNREIESLSRDVSARAYGKNILSAFRMGYLQCLFDFAPMVEEVAEEYERMVFRNERKAESKEI